MNTKGIAVAGSIIVDVGYTIDLYPQKGNLTKIYNPVKSTGGVNNIVIDLARLDDTLPIKVSGLVGRDVDGEFVKTRLLQYKNVDISNIVSRGRTSITYVMTEDSSKERTFFFDSGSSTEFDIEDIDFENLAADFFLLEYLLALGILDEADKDYGTKGAKVLANAQKHGMKTVIDMISEEKKDRYQAVIHPALKYVDFYISNEVEAGGVVGYDIHDENGVREDKVWDALRQIKALGAREWVVIHSPTCAYGLDCQSGTTIAIPSLKLPAGYIKGTTGAGDAFAAGLIYAAYQGLGLEEALKIGNWCAACSLSAADSNSGVMAFEKFNY